MGRGNEPNMMKTLEKLQRNQAQKILLETILMNNTLLQSRILSCLQPKIEKHFNYEHPERRRNDKLAEIRKELLTIAVEEKNRDLQTLKAKMIKEKEDLKEVNLSLLQQNEILKKLEDKSESTAKQLSKKVNKNVSFYLKEGTEIIFAKKKRLINRKEKKTPTGKRTTVITK